MKSRLNEREYFSKGDEHRRVQIKLKAALAKKAKTTCDYGDYSSDNSDSDSETETEDV